MQNYWLQEHISSNFNKILFNAEIVNTKMDVPKQVEDMNKDKKRWIKDKNEDHGLHSFFF